jgi:tetratricopeptide (TPR) repeat protein/tRNA A-37 threonylcarbamoyl transferase component Bud32
VRLAPEDLPRWHDLLAELLELDEPARAARLTALDDVEIRARLTQLLRVKQSPLDEPLAQRSAALLGATTEPAPLAAGAEIGPWRIERLLGEGGMARVYLAQRTHGPPQRVALKLIRAELAAPAWRERFLREQAILARLEHPGIARLIDAGLGADGEPYFATEYVDGVSLTRWCAVRALDVSRRMALFLRVLDAVQFAHRNLVVHRDLKPGNILVDGAGQPRLLDFGIARLIDDEAGAGEAHTRTLLLTPEYAAPEQFRGERATTATDVYALGAVLYELLAGQRLGARQHAEHTIAPPSRAAPVPATRRALRGDIDAIVLKALAAAPVARYASVDAFADDLRRVLRGEAISLRESQWWYRAGLALRRHWLLVLFATVAMGALATTAISAQRAARVAEAARVDVERELRRANELQNFLLGLFRAGDPLRPAAQTPSIDELLERAATTARSAGIAADVRVDMLAALARIDLARQRPELARVLIDDAMRLIDTPDAVGDAAAARALAAAALVAVQPGQGALDADALIARAQRHAQAVDGGTGYVSWRVGVDRGRVDFQRSHFADVVQHLEPLRRAAPTLPLVTDSDRFELLNTLSVAYTRAARHADAVQAFSELLAMPLLAPGVPDRRRAVVLVNARGSDLALGRFDEAEQRTREALRIYDAIFAEPRAERAAAHIGLGEVFLQRGDLQGALREFDAGNAEWARVRGVASAEDYGYTHLNRGMAYLQREQWPAARDALTRAWTLIAAMQPERSLNLLQLTHALAHSDCALGEVGAGMAKLRDARARTDALGDNADTEGAALAESTAVCAWAAQQPEQTLIEIDRALALDADAGPGYALSRARRLALRAEALMALGREAEAAQARAEAARALSTVGVPAPN